MTSIWSRKRDLVYLAFFLIHIPVMFCMHVTSSPILEHAY